MIERTKILFLLRTLLSLFFAAFFFWVTAIITDVIRVEILGAQNDYTIKWFQQILLTFSLPVGFIIGWLLIPKLILKSKFVGWIKIKTLYNFDNFQSRGARLKFAIVCVFAVYYLFILYVLSTMKGSALEALSDPNDGALIIWGPLILYGCYSLGRWIWKGKK